MGKKNKKSHHKNHHRHYRDLESQHLIPKPETSPQPPFSLMKQSYVGLFRDSFWAFSSFGAYQWPFNSLKQPWSTWLNQLGFGATGLALGAGFFAVKSSKDRTLTGGVVLAMYVIASFAAIIPWNAGQLLGDYLGEKHQDMDKNSADYYASFYCGLFEAIAQYAIISAVSAALSPEERKKWDINVKNLLQRMTEFLLVIPSGMVWQLVFTALLEWAQEDIVNQLPASGALAIGVFATSTGGGKLAEWINGKIEKLIERVDQVAEKHLNIPHHDDYDSDDYDPNKSLPNLAGHS